MQLNYDQAELNKFAAFAAHWWDPEGDLKTLHQINPLRVDYIRSRVDLKDKKVLDVGCGGGILSEALASLGAHVVGIDLSKPLIEVAKLHQLESGTNVEYHHISVESFAKHNSYKFDVICCLEMLEHVPNPLSIIKGISELAKPGADIFLSTLNRNPKSYIQAILGAEYLLQILPKTTHDYAKFIRPSELCAWLRKGHIFPVEMIGIKYNIFSKQFYINNDISVNYLLHAKKQ